MKIKYFLFLFTSIQIISSSSVFSQNTHILHSKKVDSFISLSATFFGKNLDSALYFAEKAIQLSKAQNSEINITKGLRAKAIVLTMKGDFKTADSIFISNFKRPIDSATFGYNCQSLANSYEYQGKYDLAIKNYLKAIKIYTKIDTLHLNLYRANISVATVNARIKRYNYAFDYFNKALQQAKEKGFPQSEVLTNLATIYYTAKQDYSKFIELSHKAIAFAKKEKKHHVAGYVYGNLCELYNEIEDYKNPKLALKYAKLALKEREKSGAKANYAFTYMQLAEAYLNNNEATKAIAYLSKAYPLANTTNKPDILKTLIKAHKKNGNYKLALQLSEKRNKLNDSINQTQQQQKVAKITEEYESEKKQQKIDALNTEKQLQQAKINNQLYLFITLFGVIVIIGIVLYFRYRNQKIQQQLTTQSLQHKLLQTQLNPHFLFHALNAIQSYIFQNKKEEASSYLVSYSKLMRSILESSDTDFITVEEDANAIAAFLKLQQLNVDEDAKLEIKVDPTINNYKIPPMFTQPYIENAIIHGINGIENGKVTVSYNNTPTTINVVIKDNGTGFKQDNKSNNTMHHRSMSSNILNQRIQLFKKRHLYHIKYNIASSKNGTTVTIYFPKLK